MPALRRNSALIRRAQKLFAITILFAATSATITALPAHAQSTSASRYMAGSGSREIRRPQVITNSVLPTRSFFVQATNFLPSYYACITSRQWQSRSAGRPVATKVVAGGLQ